MSDYCPRCGSPTTYICNGECDECYENRTRAREEDHERDSD